MQTQYIRWRMELRFYSYASYLPLIKIIYNYRHINNFLNDVIVFVRCYFFVYLNVSMPISCHLQLTLKIQHLFPLCPLVRIIASWVIIRCEHITGELWLWSNIWPPDPSGFVEEMNIHILRWFFLFLNDVYLNWKSHPI